MRSRNYVIYMIIGISGPRASGKSLTVAQLRGLGFEVVNFGIYSTASRLVEEITANWQHNYVFKFNDAKEEFVQLINKRPFFIHLHLDAPVTTRFERDETGLTLEQFLNLEDEQGEKFTRLKTLGRSAHICVINDFETPEQFASKLLELNLLNPERMRPSWDTYFMRLADLAATRANCMKRRVGCVIVRDKRVIATGYNGTPRGLVNCNEGGCERCNSGKGSGAGLGTCLCLHAEENALLEAGRDRIGSSGILYCNTCPCLTCSVKIAQSGITEVVYSQDYSMDQSTAKVLKEAGITLRKYIDTLR